MSMSSQSAVLSAGHSCPSGYTTKSFLSYNVKEVFLEEWLNMAKAHVPVEPGVGVSARRLGDSPADGGEIIVIIDSIVQHQRRSPMLGVPWGDFPLFPVGDPPSLSPISSRVAERHPVSAPEKEEAHPGVGPAAQAATSRPSGKHAQDRAALACATLQGAAAPEEVPRNDAGSPGVTFWAAEAGEAGEAAGGAQAAGGKAWREADMLAALQARAAAEAAPDDSSDGGASDAWAAVLTLAEHLIGSHSSPAGAQPDNPLVSGAAALASTGDATDLAADIRRLAPHADGVWVVDDGLALDASRPPVTGAPAGFLQVCLERRDRI
jgi:hypothetical protein